MQYIPVRFPDKHYFRQVRKKVRIVGHHTEGDPPGLGTVNWWKTRKGGAGTVATPYIIRADGDILHLFDDKYWAFAFGLSIPIAKTLEMGTVHIELASWGAVVPHADGGFTDNANTLARIAPEDVVTYPQPWRLGFSSFHKYTSAQIATFVELVKDISIRHGIPCRYDYETFFALNTVALSGAPGLYSHAAFRLDKADMHPQPELIAALSASFK